MKKEKDIFGGQVGDSPEHGLTHLSLGGWTHSVLSLCDLEGSGAGLEEKSWR